MLQRQKVNKWFWKNGSDRLVWHGFASKFQFVKDALSVKYMSQSAIEWDMPVPRKFLIYYFILRYKQISVRPIKKNRKGTKH